MTYRLQLQGVHHLQIGMEAVFIVTEGATNWYVSVHLEDLISATIMTDEEQAERALLTVGLRRVQSLLEGQLLAPVGGTEQIYLSLREDGEELKAATTESKSCRFHHEEQSGLYCSAAARDDQAVIGSIGLRRLAPTTPGVCDRCEMPGEPVACSALAHPDVVAMMAMGGPPERLLRTVMCSEDRDQVQTPADCQVGGHDCWHRLVEQPRSQLSSWSPMMLPEALDFLDAVWRLRYKRPLIRRTALAVGAGLSQAVSTREDFRSRVLDLAMILELEVSNEDLPGDLEGESPLRVGGINRMEQALRAKGIEIPEPATKTLRDLIGLRNSLSHQGRERDLQTNLRSLGARPGHDSWGAMWDTVAARVVGALSELRNAVRLWD